MRFTRCVHRSKNAAQGNKALSLKYTRRVSKRRTQQCGNASHLTTSTSSTNEIQIQINNSVRCSTSAVEILFTAVTTENVCCCITVCAYDYRRMFIKSISKLYSQ
uniref:SET domain-containing protein 4 n=1 Tax=Zeugodacus cucurbitae TaxID=28588 RepID=A0A0A1WJZ5_ZEUCU